MATVAKAIPTRQSPRKKSKPVARAGGPSLDEDEDEDVVDRDNIQVPPNKRQKHTGHIEPQKTRPRKAGKLQSLPEMPLDILYEIFSNLKPLDLLRLSRTTHALRNLLTRRSAMSIWKRARENVDDLPGLPNDLNEIQYADLLFVSRCHECGSSYPLKEVFWQARMRLCKSCFDTVFVDYFQLIEGDSRETPTHFIDLVPSVSQQVGGGRRSRYLRFVLCHSRLHYEQLMQEYEQAKASGNLDAWFILKRAHVKEVEIHAAECSRWYHQQTANRTNDLSELRAKRRASILSRLRDLGWGLEIDNLTADQTHEFNRHSTVNQPKELTPRIWSNISPAVLALFETFKAGRILRERYALIKSRQSVVETLLNVYRLAHSDEVVPALVDVCYFPAIRPLIENPLSDELDKDLLEESLKDLPTQAKAWCADKDQELLRIVAEDTGKPLENLFQLQLATTWFADRDNTSLSHPAVLVHRDAGRLYSFEFDPNGPDIQLHSRSSILQRSPWNHRSSLAFDKRAYRNVIKVLEACALDPTSTTTEFLDKVNPWLECCTCDRTYRVVMPWRTAVTHRCMGGQPEFVQCSQDVIALATASAPYSDPLKLWSNRYRCGHCNHQEEGRYFRNHCKESHNVEAPVFKVDYHELLEYPVYQKEVRLLRDEVDPQDSDAPSSDFHDYDDYLWQLLHS